MWHVWSADPPPGHCSLHPVFIDAWNAMREGQSVVSSLGEPVRVKMSALFPDDHLVSDNMETAGFIIISRRLKEHLAVALGSARVEFLPTIVLDHDGAVASTEHFVVHPLDIVDCIDTKASKVKWSPLNRTRITSCKSLVLVERALENAVPVFRPMHWTSLLMVSGSVAATLEAAAFTGLHFPTVAGFDGVS